MIQYLNTFLSCTILFIVSATVDGSDFEGADMTLANIELAQVSNCFYNF